MSDDATNWRSAEMIRRRLAQDPRVLAMWARAQRHVTKTPDRCASMALNVFCHFVGMLLLSHNWGYAVALGFVILVLSTADYAQRAIEWIGIVLLVLGFARAAGAFPF